MSKLYVVSNKQTEVDQMKVREKEVVAIEMAGGKKEDSTTEQTIVRFKNARRPRKAAGLNLMTDSKQSLVGDYSCCSRVP